MYCKTAPLKFAPQCAFLWIIGSFSIRFLHSTESPTASDGVDLPIEWKQTLAFLFNLEKLSGISALAQIELLLLCAKIRVDGLSIYSEELYFST